MLRGQRHSDESKARMRKPKSADHRAAISVTLSGVEKSDQHRQRIGEGVALAARARVSGGKWRTRLRDNPSPPLTREELRDYILSIVFSQVTKWQVSQWMRLVEDTRGAPAGVKLISRDEFEKLSEGRQRSVRISYVREWKIVGTDAYGLPDIEIVFVDGSKYPGNAIHPELDHLAG